MNGMRHIHKVTRKGVWRYGVLMCVAAVLAACAGCATAPMTGRSQFIVTDESSDLRLGAQASQQIMKESELETGTARSARVERVGRRIAAVAERPNYQWEFHTIKSKELNAFCLDGGKIFVYTAMLDFTEGRDDELAAVIGHEVAHALARHGAERRSQNMASGVGQAVLGIAASILTGSSAAGDAVQEGTGALASLGLLLPYSRLQETEADHIGIILAAKAGYDPEAAISLWEKMQKSNEGKEPPQLLSTHPVTSQRIVDLKNFMPEALQYYHPAR